MQGIGGQGQEEHGLGVSQSPCGALLLASVPPIHGLRKGETLARSPVSVILESKETGLERSILG